MGKVVSFTNPDDIQVQPVSVPPPLFSNDDEAFQFAFEPDRFWGDKLNRLEEYLKASGGDPNGNVA